MNIPCVGLHCTLAVEIPTAAVAAINFRNCMTDEIRQYDNSSSDMGESILNVRLLDQGYKSIQCLLRYSVSPRVPMLATDGPRTDKGAHNTYLGRGPHGIY